MLLSWRFRGTVRGSISRSPGSGSAVFVVAIFPPLEPAVIPISISILPSPFVRAAFDAGSPLFFPVASLVSLVFPVSLVALVSLMSLVFLVPVFGMGGW